MRQETPTLIAFADRSEIKQLPMGTSRFTHFRSITHVKSEYRG